MLALWEYFWTEADWTPAPAPAPSASVADIDRGSGKGHKPFIWESAGPDYWDVREQHLKRLFPEPAPAPIPKRAPELAPKPKLDIEAEYRNVYIKALRAQTKSQFQQNLYRLGELSGQIQNLRSQYDEEAVLLLLLNL